MSKNIVIVPDGIAFCNELNRQKAVPSAHYRGSLLRALGLADFGDRIYLAPGNTFGSPLYEQQLAELFLREK